MARTVRLQCEWRLHFSDIEGMRQRCMEVEKAVDGFKSQQMDAVGIRND